jgi:hypothetical protein
VHSGMLVTVIMLMIACKFFILLYNHRLWVAYSGILVTMIMLMIDIDCMSILHSVLSI